MGFKAGLEVHVQLDTQHKLFCDCSTGMKERAPIAVVTRKLHPVASELGEVDRAVQFEFLRNRTFHYQVFKDESCLVELDEEPPHPVNREALETALQISLMLNCRIPNEIYVMRKTVIDGSNTSGFQRTMTIGMDGHFEYKGKKIPITYVTLEEDAAASVENKEVTYRLNRLGVPLVEIDTGILEGFTPEEVQEIAYMIGLFAKSTHKVKRGIGTIRQDINISTGKGGRVELKGLQELNTFAKVIQLEINRQKSLQKIENETRGVKTDGSSEYMRPLPGAARMYPETDIPPVSLTTKYLAELKKSLPESLTKKLHRFEAQFKLSPQLAREVVRSDYVDVFEEMSKKAEPSIVAGTFTSILKDLERSGVEVWNITESNFEDLFENLARKTIAKEAIPEILRSLAQDNSQKVSEVTKKLGLAKMSEAEIEKIVRGISPGTPFNKAVGIVMSQVRGKADAQTVIKVVKRVFKN